MWLLGLWYQSSAGWVAYTQTCVLLLFWRWGSLRWRCWQNQLFLRLVSLACRWWSLCRHMVFRPSLSVSWFHPLQTLVILGWRPSLPQWPHFNLSLWSVSLLSVSVGFVDPIISQVPAPSMVWQQTAFLLVLRLRLTLHPPLHLHFPLWLLCRCAPAPSLPLSDGFSASFSGSSFPSRDLAQTR